MNPQQLTQALRGGKADRVFKPLYGDSPAEIERQRERYIHAVSRFAELFPRAEFKKDGFYLNGKRFKLRGLNRHQSYPFAGYAMPRSMQRLDADILKYELGCNAVRTSHYPQSHHFIDRCDELGLPVFTEIPGWQNLGEAPVILRAGMSGFYVRTKGKAGKACVTLRADGCESLTISFTVTVNNA